MPTAPDRASAAAIALIAGSALLVQVGLNMVDRGQSLGEALFNLFGFFTIWSNLAVVLVAARAAAGRGDDLLARPQLQAAVVAWIIVVGVIYNTLLIGLNPVSGIRWITDRVFHMATPLAWPAWWLAFRARGALAWRHLPTAMAVPALYCAFTLVKGAYTLKYPYFFLNVAKLGWPQTLINITGLVALFVALMAAIILLDRRAARAPA